MARVLLHAPAAGGARLGGGQTYVGCLAAELLRRGCSVTVAASGDEAPGSRVPTRSGLTSPTLRVFRGPNDLSIMTPVERQGGLGQRSLAVARSVLDAVRPDIAHLDDTSPAMVLAAQSLGIPSIVVAHHAGIACPAGDLLLATGEICPHRMGIEPCVRCCTGRRAGGAAAGRLLAGIPGPLRGGLGRIINRLDPPSTLLRGLMYPWAIELRIAAYRARLEAADVIVAPSRFMADLLARNGVPPDKIRFEPHGVAVPAPRPIDELEARPFRVGYAGRITRNKGLHVLVEAAARIARSDEIELLVAGDATSPGDQRYLEDVRARAGGLRMRLLGRLAEDEMQRFYAALHMVVVPSLVPEAFGLVVAEAFANGRPVIVSDAGALPELVRDGVDGFVVPRGDAAQLSVRLKALVNDRGLVGRLAGGVRPPRTIADYADAIEQLYEELLAAKAGADAGADA